MNPDSRSPKMKKSQPNANGLRLAEVDVDHDPMDISRGVHTEVAQEAEASRVAGRRLGREEHNPLGGSHAPTLPYTYAPAPGPHSFFDPNVPWPAAAYLDPGVESRVAPEH